LSRSTRGYSRCLFIAIAGFVFLAAAPRTRKSAATAAQAASPPAGWNSNLESVLNLMDKAAAGFESAEADFVWATYSKIADVTDTQKGKIYFRRTGKGIEMAANITYPADAPKSILLANGKAQMFQPNENEVDVFATDKNRDAFETFLLLGFGGGGHSLLKSFDVQYLGQEKLPDGTPTAKLQLVPKSDAIRNNFDKFILWIDSRGILVQEQIFSGSDYKMQKYSNIKLNQKLPKSVFTLKTNGATKVVTH
jgi:outer membrane lipoprotein-sorting protein